MIELQSHSTVSDGQLPPAEVVEKAAEAGVSVLALTDHDGVAGVPEAIEAGERLGVEIVPAIEMSSVHEYAPDLHICGYWIDLEKMQPACDRAQQERRERAQQIVRNLQDLGVDVTFERAVEEAGAADAIGRPHIAHAAGAADNMGPFFEEYLVPGAKAFVSRKWPDADEACATIRAAGGVPVLAHPYWDLDKAEEVEQLVRALDLGGIEVYYPPHTKQETEHLLGLAHELGISATASSDYHGPTHKTFSRFGAYNTYDLGEPEIPPKP